MKKPDKDILDRLRGKKPSLGSSSTQAVATTNDAQRAAAEAAAAAKAAAKRAEELAFIDSCRKNYLGNVRDALAAGMNPNVVNDHGVSGLMMAVAKGHIQIVALLLEYQADVNTQSNHGGDALLSALEANKPMLVDYLLRAGANPNRCYHQGLTALMIAARDGQWRMVKALLKAGAEPSVKDMRGKTALDHAKKRHHSGVINLLEQQAQPAAVRRRRQPLRGFAP